MKTAGYKKLLADAEYFITCKDQYADIIIDGKIKQGAKLLVSFAEQYCEEKMKSILSEFLKYAEERESNDPEIIDEFLDQTTVTIILNKPTEREYVIMLKSTYKSKDGTIKECQYQDGKHYAPKDDLDQTNKQ